MNIVVGITGGIAAYKAPELVRQLVKAGHTVRCAVTEHALQFVTRVTLETVSGAPLYSDLFASGGTEHISLKDWGDMLVVAPATANIIGKVASGIADDALGPVEHLAGGAVGESEEQYPVRRDALLYEIGDSVDERAGLAGPRCGEHEKRSAAGSCRGELFRIQ